MLIPIQNPAAYGRGVLCVSSLSYYNIAMTRKKIILIVSTFALLVMGTSWYWFGYHPEPAFNLEDIMDDAERYGMLSMQEDGVPDEEAVSREVPVRSTPFVRRVREDERIESVMRHVDVRPRISVPQTNMEVWTECVEVVTSEGAQCADRFMVEDGSGDEYVAFETGPDIVSNGSISGIQVSPDGRYAYFNVLYWEHEVAYYVDFMNRMVVRLNGIAYETGGKVSDGLPYSRMPHIAWSPTGMRMAVDSYGSSIGYGSNALYVSATGNPEDLISIFSLSEETESGHILDRGVESVDNLNVTEDTVVFDVVYGDHTARYEYLFATKELNVR
jgi:hypothetical protein